MLHKNVKVSLKITLEFPQFDHQVVDSAYWQYKDFQYDRCNIGYIWKHRIVKDVCSKKEMNEETSDQYFYHFTTQIYLLS